MWRAAIHVKNKTKFLGYYDDEEDAALAYNQTVKNLLLTRSLNTVLVHQQKLIKLLQKLEPGTTIKKTSSTGYSICE